MIKLFILLSLLQLNAVLGSEFSEALNKAISARKSKDYPTAISAYSTALKQCKIDWQRLSCLFNLANCYFSNQQYAEAIPHLDQILILEDLQDKPNDARINSTLNFKINAFKKLEKFQLAMDTLNILIQRKSVSDAMKNSAKKTMIYISKKEKITLPENYDLETPVPSPDTVKSSEPAQTFNQDEGLEFDKSITKPKAELIQI